MESQPQNPEFRNNPENFHPCIFNESRGLNFCLSLHLNPNYVHVSREDSGEPESSLPHNVISAKISFAAWVKVQNFQNPELKKF